MAQGQVSINTINLAQGDAPEIERKALFIGRGSKNIGQVLALNAQSDLHELLGVHNSEIKSQIQAARANGGEHWQAFAAPQAGDADLSAVIDAAMAVVSPELLVLCTPVADTAAVEALHAQAEAMRQTLARRVIVLAATPGINPHPTSGQSWSEYQAAQAALVNGVAAYRVACVPQLHGNDLGALAGRLCHGAVSIADSPMRVASGPVLGLGATPVDKQGVALDAATLSALDAARLSCIQRYVDYPGTYWGDGNLLDVPGGDYQVIEHLRPIDKAARAVRLLAIARIANRSFNHTPLSIAAHTTYFMRPLRAMSRSVSVAGQVLPGDIQAPTDEAITLHWPSRTRVEIYLRLRPYHAPKHISANLVLDLSSGA